MKSIDHLPGTEREHYNFCPDCQLWFDMRDLEQVMDHFHFSGKIPVEWSGANQPGSTVFYSNKSIRTNPLLKRKIRTDILRKINLSLKTRSYEQKGSAQKN